jgi:hypothetical protein
MNKLLFLDFDGVLHPNFSLGGDHFSRVDILMDVLGSHAAELEVIISSSWRFQYPFDVVLGFLPEELRRLVSGATPEVEPGRHQRHREILAFLNWRKGQPEWRALDDDLGGFPKDCPELIVCDGRVGIDSGSTQRLLSWLGRAG